MEPYEIVLVGIGGLFLLDKMSGYTMTDCISKRTEKYSIKTYRKFRKIVKQAETEKYNM